MSTRTTPRTVVAGSDSKPQSERAIAHPTRLNELESSPDRVTWSLFVRAALLVIGIWSASALGLYFFASDFSKSGTFGDSFGVLNTLFSGLAFAGIIVSIKMQNDEMREQRKELQKQKKNALLYHRERMFLLLMDEFKKSRESRYTVVDVRMVINDCLGYNAAINTDDSSPVASLMDEVESVLSGARIETPLLQTFSRRVFRHELCEVFIKTFHQAAESVKKFDQASRGEYYDIVCNSMSDPEEALLFLCFVARCGVHTPQNSQAMKLRESFDEIKDKLV